MQIVEFKNQKKNILRGVVTNKKSKKGIIFVHGFERNSYEYKFRNIFFEIKDKYSTMRFDFSGCGLSEGKFDDFSVEKSTFELEAAVKKFKKVCPELQEIVIVGHSIAGCISVNLLQEKNKFIKKLVLLGPAWNQEKILKYYFVRAMFKGKKDIDWNNYEKNLDEKKYSLFMKQKKYERKAHWLNSSYFNENDGIDYQDMLETLTISLEDIMVIQSKEDKKVPFESNDRIPKKMKQIVVKKADHDFETPSAVKQYLKKVVKFISE